MHTIEYYGGPWDGRRISVSERIPRGTCGAHANRYDYYIFDGRRRFVWSGTQEGHILVAENEAKRRG